VTAIIPKFDPETIARLQQVMVNTRLSCARFAYEDVLAGTPTIGVGIKSVSPLLTQAISNRKIRAGVVQN